MYDSTEFRRLSSRKKVHKYALPALVGSLIVAGVVIAIVLSSNTAHEEETGTPSSQSPLEMKPGYCSLYPDPGMCEAAIPRFFFNVTSDSCESFTYGGCDGNSNNFETLAECSASCGSSCSCSQQYDPVCGSDGVTYSNRGCMKCADPSLEVASEGECPPKSFPELCQLPSVHGPCQPFQRIVRYFYNVDTEQCEEFDYGGCDGNANNFETKAQCETQCSGAKLQCDLCNVFQDKVCASDAKTYNNSRCMTCANSSLRVKYAGECQDVCKLDVDIGPCDALMKRFFFDSKTGKCAEFNYGGCQGNANNFASKEECAKFCPESSCMCTGQYDPYCGTDAKTYSNLCTLNCTVPQVTPRSQGTCKEMCALPLVPGPCRGSFTRYWHNSTSGTCEKFVYGGCQGNANNFEKESDCQRFCVHK